MKIRIKFGPADGRELVAKNMQTAALRDVREFQRQSGMKMADIQEEVELSDGAALGTAICAFLSLHNAGFRTYTWEEVLDRTQDDLQMIEEKQDQAMREEAEAEEAAATAGPRRARTASRSGGHAPGHAPTPAATQQ